MDKGAGIVRKMPGITCREIHCPLTHDRIPRCVIEYAIEHHVDRVHRDRTGIGFFDENLGPSRATPWRAGANETTTISFSHDVRIDGKELKAGTYGLFLELEKDGPWMWIFSQDSTGWGSFQYDPKHDAMRVPATPQDAPYTEFLTYGFDERRPDSALAYLQWERKRIAFKIDVPDVNELYVAQIRRDLQGWPGFKYQNWQIAAQFCANHKINLEEALVWANKAITEPFKGPTRGHEDSSTLATKAAVLQAMGRNSEADATIDKALSLPEPDVVRIYSYASSVLTAGRKERNCRFLRPTSDCIPARNSGRLWDLHKATRRWVTRRTP